MFRWLFLCITISVYAHISLDVESMDGQRINQVAIGQPFKLVVTLENIPQNKVPEIEHIEHFNPRRISYNFTDINGHGVVRYIYQLQANKLGTFEIGPAYIKLPNYQDYSDTLTLTVAKEQKVNTKAKQTSNNPTTFVRLITDRERLVVGEKAHCKLTLYTNNRSLSIEHAAIPPAQEWNVTTPICTQEGEQIVDGKRYTAVSWSFECTPEKEGTLTFPACAVNVLIPAHNSFGFAALFGARFEAKRMYSNGLSFEVAQAPPAVDFIGTISDARISVSAKNAKVGDGLLCSYIISGQGNFDTFKPNISLPKSCKSYFSQDRTDSMNGVETRIYEYVVQPIKEGMLTIPSQTITYFDTDTRKIKKIKTNKVECTVAGTSSSSEINPEINIDNSIPAIKKVPSLHTTNWFRTEQKKLPWMLFFIIFLIPFGWHGYYRYIAYKARNRFSYRRAYTLLKQAEQSKSFHQLYRVFSEFIKEKNITHEELVARLEKEQNGIAHDWQQFWQELTTHVFCKSKCKDYALFIQAFDWLTRIRKII